MLNFKIDSSWRRLDGNFALALNLAIASSTINLKCKYSFIISPIVFTSGVLSTEVLWKWGPAVEIFASEANMFLSPILNSPKSQQNICCSQFSNRVFKSVILFLLLISRSIEWILSFSYNFSLVFLLIQKMKQKIHHFFYYKLFFLVFIWMTIKIFSNNYDSIFRNALGVVKSCSLLFLFSLKICKVIIYVRLLQDCSI